MMLSFRLLGTVTLYNNERPLTRFRSQKEAALLIYLAQTGHSYQRDFIAELFWGGRSTQQALSNLRTVLARLRKQVGEDLVVTRKSLSLAPESRQQVDSVLLLETLASIGNVDSMEEANLLDKALDAYRGDFLAGFHLPDAPQFDAWVLTTRERIRRQVITAYDKLGQYALATGDVEYGDAIARRWLRVDALDEAAHFLLIQTLIAAGRVREAVAEYDACVELLRAELNVGPPAKMTALIQKAQPAPPAIKRPPANVHHNLPKDHNQFFGRVHVRQEIHARLDQPWCRLVTLLGPGGVGKTRLATAVARDRLGRYADGAWLVELADIDPHDPDVAEAIAVEIAIALDIRLSGSKKPVEQLLSHLQHRQMLLVLDNIEHLIEGGVEFVLDVIQRCENVQLLVTSREALGVRAEWTIALAGLDHSTSDADDRPSDAVALFMARQAQNQWREPTADDLTAVRQICRMVEGLPLAVELAAGLTPGVMPREIADQLRAGFDALATTLRDAPQRHRSLQTVFEMSWRTLSPGLQQRLARLSAFRGGLTLAAAQSIADADEQDLATLCEKSLLSYDATTERYRLHPVVRAYAAEKLPATNQIAQRHADYYLTLLAQHTKPLQKDDPQSSMAVIEPDMANVRLAWEAGLAQRQTALLSAALTPLSIYYRLRGLALEGEAVMHNTCRTAATWGPDGLALTTRPGLERARFQIRLGRYRAAIQTVETALRNARRSADPWAEGMGHVLWGEALWRLGEYEAARKKLTLALDIAHAHHATRIIGWSHHHLGVINDIQGRYAAALDHLLQACDAWRTVDNAQALSNSLNSIGLVYYHQHHLLAAQQVMEQALTICYHLDNRHLQAFLLNNLSIIATEQDDYSSAQHYLQRGLELAITGGNLTAQGEIYTNLGQNHLLLGETDLSVECLEEGLRIAESMGNRSLAATATLNLAEIARENGELERAESLYNHVLRIARHDNLDLLACEALIGIIEILCESDATMARQYSDQAIALAKTLQNPRLLARANAVAAMTAGRQ